MTSSAWIAPPPATVAAVDEFAEWEAASTQPAELRLKSGESWKGWSFGAKTSVAGEVVFSTNMVGYPESLTDPSFAGQILVMTYPLIGNYGVPDDTFDETGLLANFEGEKIYPVAVVVAEYSFTASHYAAKKTLAKWLEEHNVPAVFGVDTRAITKILREHGSSLGAIVFGSSETITPMWVDPNERNLVADVSIKQVKTFEPRGGASPKTPLIVAVDCGMKYNIIRFFVRHLQVRLKVVPWDYDFTEEEFDGLFISNGPGDPMKCVKTIDCLAKCMKTRPNLPIFGICLGHQLLSIAAGAKTYKMKFGNRGVNQPCVDLRTGRCYITSQNHGFAVEDTNLPNGWRALFTNANDGSNEGIAHANRPWQSVQFHPEASGGPLDTYFLFDEFLRIVTNSQSRFMTTIQYKPPRQISKVLVLGSGGLTIGQAGEFDYSGAQAIKALREQHVQSVLINPNIATVQTSKGLADQIYLLPVTPEFVTKVIEKVRPDGLFAAFGGQTALNCAIELHKDGTLKKYGVQVLGTQIDAIVATEDRKLFKDGVESIGEKVAESGTADSVEGARATAARIGYPVLVRAAFALGGLGSGFAQNEAELEALCAKAFINSPQVIIDECLRGWKELEYEVMRDSHDNTLVVCNMENIDPMGIHTGDSIVVAPSQTLSNDEYNKLRDTAIKVIRHFGIVGEANIQYALDPYSKKYRIVEVNPRLSRSSALASKATGYPLAYIAAKIALGHDLVSLRNQVTRCTTACFEPSLDYCVVKIPRWDLDKFPTVDKTLGPQMKSVGEVMSIGRCFSEATQKAMRMVNEASVGFDESFYLRTKSDERTLEQDLGEPGPTRMWAIAHAFNSGKTIDEVHAITMIDRWFLSKLFCITQMRKKFASLGGLKEMDAGKTSLLRRAKQYGFSDKQVALALGNCTARDVFHLREEWKIRPFVKLVDTLAAEFPAQTNYLYLTYAGSEHDVQPLKLAVLPAYKDSLYDTAFGKGHLEDEHGMPTKKSFVNVAGAGDHLHNKLMDAATKTVRAASLRPGEERSSFIVLGSGCYRIGASVEFDWGCVNAVRTLRETGHRAMVINCNPETVSTDYDESDRLYFEELSLETVLEICSFEDPTGVIVSVGGQTPNNLAPHLHMHGVPLLGTSASSIDMAEDRSKFSALCDALGVDQPEWSEFTKFEDALAFAGSVSFPVLVRPSYVLSGAAMRVIDDETELRSFLSGQAVVEQEHPVVISKYHSGAREIEFDAVARQGKLVNYAISEHVEDAGTHSGDATLLLPAQTLSLETHRDVMQIAKQLCRALNISGPFNVQFLAKEGSSSSMREVKVIECNLRASRTVPFVSKTFDVNFIELATRVMLGQEVKSVPVHLLDFEFVACKVAMFSFLRLSGADPHYGVEMQSTGEIACFGKDSQEAFLKAMLAAGHKLPRGPTGLLLALGPQADKVCFVPFLMLLAEMGYTLYGTKGTAAFFNDQNLTCASKAVTVTPLETAAAQTDAIDQKQVEIVITTPSSRDSGGATAGYFLRRKALDSGMALVVDIRLAMKLVDALYQKYNCGKKGTEFWTIESWHETQRVG